MHRCWLIWFRFGQWLFCRGDDDVAVLTLLSESAVDLIDSAAILQAGQMRLLRVRYTPGPPIVYFADFDRQGEPMTEADIAAVVAQINARTAQISGLATPP